MVAAEEEMQREAANVREIDGFDLYPEYDDQPPVDVDGPLRPLDDGGISWADTRPAPLDREAAERAFVQMLREVIDDEDLRDPADPTGNTVILTPTILHTRYPYRSRPFYSEILRDAIGGKVTPPPHLMLSRADDLGPGKYRLSRVPVTDHSQ